ncbi:MAG: hypothetical protein BAJATHORv1_10521 [Candidatus Thorarchaeota archaeon]|nr:MAG: hypothetical protein BAJATHORv1_10521 [Candidatus Thorarchaeota archaeon]
MSRYEKTVQEINERIEDGSVMVVTAAEMSDLVAELGPKGAVHEVDVVTTGTFGAMCSSGMWMNFGHSEPPMKMSKVWLNDVEAYAGVAAVDAYLGATQLSESRGMAYGGGHVIEDLLKGKAIQLRAEAYGTDCYPRRELSTEITLDDLNQAVLSNPRNCYERYGVATNSTEKTLYTYMGKLLPEMGNATFSGAGELSPIINDPSYRAIGIGTRILLGGTESYIIGNGTQHSPDGGFGTLMVQGDLKKMSPEFIRGISLTNYGTSLFVGVGVPIPILNEDIAKSTGVSDVDIVTNVFDYGVPSRNRPLLKRVTYEELKSGCIELNGRDVKTSPISSFRMASRIASLLKRQIATGRFFLTEPAQKLCAHGSAKSMGQREPNGSESIPSVVHIPEGQSVYRDEEACIQCGLCVAYCEAGVFRRDTEWRVNYDPTLCQECGVCGDVCPHGAIHLRS